MKLPWVKFKERKPECGKPLLLFFGQISGEPSWSLKGILISYGGMEKLNNGTVRFGLLNSESASSEEDLIPTPDELNNLYWIELSNPEEGNSSFVQILQDVYESSSEESYHC